MSVQEKVSLYTGAADENRMMMLQLRAGDENVYGVNVFKIQEISLCPRLHKVQGYHDNVAGLADVRGQVFPVIDLCLALTGQPTPSDERRLLLISEFCGQIQGFIVTEAGRVVSISWSEIEPPPPALSTQVCCTAMVKQDNDEIVAILDLEALCWQVLFRPPDFKRLQEAKVSDEPRYILIVDDSQTARDLLTRAIDSLGFKSRAFENGVDALEHLDRCVDPYAEVLMVISDIEMPKMDGFEFTRKVKENERTKDLRVVMHSSLSGAANIRFGDKAGADAHIPKFDPERIREVVLEGYRLRLEHDVKRAAAAGQSNLN